MSANKARMIIFIIFAIFFLVNLAAALSMSVRFDRFHFGWDDLKDLLTKIIAIYGIYLSMMITSQFSREKGKAASVDKYTFVIALSLCSIWNLLFSFIIILYCIKPYELQTLITTLDDIVVALANILIIGVLAYFFTGQKGISEVKDG
jgi:hypothetical protein